jgi:hypothetical protein
VFNLFLIVALVVALLVPTSRAWLFDRFVRFVNVFHKGAAAWLATKLGVLSTDIDAFEAKVKANIPYEAQIESAMKKAGDDVYAAYKAAKASVAP